MRNGQGFDANRSRFSQLRTPNFILLVVSSKKDAASFLTHAAQEAVSLHIYTRHHAVSVPRYGIRLRL